MVSEFLEVHPDLAAIPSRSTFLKTKGSFFFYDAKEQLQQLVLLVHDSRNWSGAYMLAFLMYFQLYRLI